MYVLDIGLSLLKPKITLFCVRLFFSPFFDEVRIGKQGSSECDHIGKVAVQHRLDPIGSAHSTGRNNGELCLFTDPYQRIRLRFFRQTGVVEIPRRTEATRYLGPD